MPSSVSRRVTTADTAKLVFGVVFSLRNMVRRLGGDDDEFISYRTGDYKLHYYETPTSMKFVLLTDTKMTDLRVYLHQIWANLYVEYVVKNPLSPVEHPGGVGVNSELFELGLTRFIVCSLSSQAARLMLTLPGLCVPVLNCTQHAVTSASAVLMPPWLRSSFFGRQSRSAQMALQ